jgi:energy-coupling factor transporter ATP-binding protein EcfA2
MRIKRLLVSNLFNMFDHPIELNLEDHITIIHGPNGFGKTVILRMIDGLFNARYGIFRAVPFNMLIVDFTDGRSLRIEQSESENGDGQTARRVVLYGPESDNEPFELSMVDRDRLPIPIGAIEDIVPELVQVGPREWIDRTSDKTLTLEDVIHEYGVFFPNLPYKTPEWLLEIREEIPVHFVQTERLVSRIPQHRYRTRVERYPETTSTVLIYSQDLANSIQKTLAKSVEFSSSLDRSFPSRLMNLIKRGDAPELDEAELRIELNDLEQKRSRLMEAGLLERGEVAVDIPEESLSQEMLKVLSCM